jgi:hypothetical protein
VARLAGLADQIRDGALPFAHETAADLASELQHRLRQAGGSNRTHT